jgi:Fic family protein
MIDTIQSAVEEGLLEFLYKNTQGSSSEIHTFIVQKEASDVSLVTIKRLLSKLHREGSLSVTGKGPATRYALTTAGRLFAKVDAKKYCTQEPDRRFGFSTYQFELFSSLPSEIFLAEEVAFLDTVTSQYHERSKNISETLHRKELERFIIELSWKSSKIEGNTYTLLDTEKLILYGNEAPGKTKDEMAMILNHKEAFTFIYENQNSFKTLSRMGIEHVHSLLTKDLRIVRNFRHSPVGIIGSRYRPPDNKYQIEEAVTVLLEAVNSMRSTYAKALVTLLGLSYIQPFEDGNKRTARLMSDALLLAHGLTPLSYRSVREEEYREATLIFYELNSLEPFKRIFIDQYTFAAENYLL